MNVRTFPFTDFPGQSRLFLDTVAHTLPGTLSAQTPLTAVVDRLSAHPDNRAAMTGILLNQAQQFGSDETATASIRELTDPSAVVVIAGQQGGWYGGPMLSLVKALTVVKAAKRWKEKLGRPVVPVFWIASDDHDLDEIRFTSVLNRQGLLQRLEYPSGNDGRAAGETILRDEAALTASAELLRGALGESEFTPALYDAIDTSYRPTETFASAFGRLLARLTAGTGLVLFSPTDPSVKKLAVPFFDRLIAEQGKLAESFQRRNEELLAAGYHLQVEKRPEYAHLFYHAPRRLPIMRAGERWQTEAMAWTTAELRADVARRPECFSTNVLTRPLLQSWLFPVIAQFGGPAEIAYLHQIAPMFADLALVRPQQLPRPGVTIIDQRTDELLIRAGLTLPMLPGRGTDEIIAGILRASFPDAIQAELEHVRERLKAEASNLAPIGSRFDLQLAEFAEQTAGKIDFLVRQFAERLQQSHRRKEKETTDRWTKALTLLIPERGLQERTINVFSFIARFGPGVTGQIYDAIDPDCPAHHLLSI